METVEQHPRPGGATINGGVPNGETVKGNSYFCELTDYVYMI